VLDLEHVADVAALAVDAGSRSADAVMATHHLRAP
jgi:hypothetical protein